MEFSGLAADLWSQKLISVEDSGPFIAAFAKNLFFAEDLGIKTIRVDTVEPITVMKEKNLDPKLVMDRVARAFDLCSKLAANRGINICWEFEPGFPINKPSEILELVEARPRRRQEPQFRRPLRFLPCLHVRRRRREPDRRQGNAARRRTGAAAKAPGQDHAHPPDRLGWHLNEHNTSTHNPFGTGKLNFDKLIPA